MTKKFIYQYHGNIQDERKHYKDLGQKIILEKLSEGPSAEFLFPAVDLVLNIEVRTILQSQSLNLVNRKLGYKK